MRILSPLNPCLLRDLVESKALLGFESKDLLDLKAKFCWNLIDCVCVLSFPGLPRYVDSLLLECGTNSKA